MDPSFSFAPGLGSISGNLSKRAEIAEARAKRLEGVLVSARFALAKQNWRAVKAILGEAAEG